MKTSVAEPGRVSESMERLSAMTFHAAMTTPATEALGATATLTIGFDGAYELRLQMRSDDLDDYSFRLAFILRAADGSVFALFSAGILRGALSPAPHEIAEHQHGESRALRERWSAFAGASLEAHREFVTGPAPWASGSWVEAITYVAACVERDGPTTRVLFGGRLLADAAAAWRPGVLGLFGGKDDGRCLMLTPTGLLPVFVDRPPAPSVTPSASSTDRVGSRGSRSRPSSPRRSEWPGTRPAGPAPVPAPGTTPPGAAAPSSRRG